jgi:hypothetical protein
MQAGLFPLAQPAVVQHGLIPLTPRRLAVGVMRYLGGDLRYDLFFAASPVRHRHRTGIQLHHLLVSSPAAVRAAAGEWGLPARTASFSWSDGQVTVTDDSGFRTVLAMSSRIPVTAPVLVPLSCFGTHKEWLIYCDITVRARARPGRMRILAWPGELPGLRRQATAVAFDIPRFRMYMPQARPIALL